MTVAGSTSARPSAYKLTQDVIEREREQFRYSFLYPSLSERHRALCWAIGALAVGAVLAWYALTQRSGIGLLGIVALVVTIVSWRWVRMMWCEWRRYTPEAERVRDYLLATTLEANAGVHMPGWETARTAEGRTARCAHFSGDNAQGPGTVGRMSLQRRVGEEYEAARAADDWRRRQHLAAWLLWLELEPSSGDDYVPAVSDHQNPADRRFAEAVVTIARKELEGAHPWRASVEWPPEPFTLSREVMVRGLAFATHEIAQAMLTAGGAAMAAAMAHWEGLGASDTSTANLSDLLGLAGRIRDATTSHLEDGRARQEPIPERLMEPPGAVPSSTQPQERAMFQTYAPCTLSHTEFVAAFRAKQLAVRADQSLAVRVHTIPLMPMRYRIAHGLWSWIWLLMFPAAIALGIWYHWWGGVLCLLAMVPVSAGIKQAAADNVLEHALEDEAFYNRMAEVRLFWVAPAQPSGAVVSR